MFFLLFVNYRHWQIDNHYAMTKCVQKCQFEVVAGSLAVRKKHFVADKCTVTKLVTGY